MAVEDPNGVHLGQFWLPNGDVKVGGLLRYEPTGVHLTLSPAILKRSIDLASPEDGDVRSSSTVHGSVFDLGPVSILPATSTKTRANWRAAGFVDEEEVEGSWLLAGEYITEEDFQPTTLRVDLSFLALWMDRGHVAVFPDRAEGRGARIGPMLCDDLSGNLPCGGTLTVCTDGARYVHRPPTTRLEVPTWVEFELDEGLSMEMWWQRFVSPTADLLSLLYWEECKVLRAEVCCGPDEVWRSVHGLNIDPLGASTDAEALLDAYEFGADALASWAEVCERFNPSVRILVSSVANQMSLEVDLLTLCTAAEGLHRRAYPESRRFTPSEVEEVFGQIALDSLSDAQKWALGSARDYFHEPSFASRIEALGLRVETVAPGCVGKVNRLKRAMTDARIRLAHGTKSGYASDEEVRQDWALLRSLRWLMTVFLLLEAGVDEELLREKLATHKRYTRDCAFMARHLPKVFPAD